MLVLENVLTPAVLGEVQKFLDTASFVDGKATAGALIRDRKNNEQLERRPGEVVPVDSLVLQSLARHPIFQAWAIPHRISAPMFNRHGPGMFYGNHVDRAIAGGNPPLRADVSVSVLLSDPADYDGGELVVESAGGPRAVKPPRGGAVIYLSNALHRVNEVTRGERVAAVMWVQSMVPDDRVRQILFDLAAVQEAAASVMNGSPAFDLLLKAQNNLLRLNTVI